MGNSYCPPDMPGGQEQAPSPRFHLHWLAEGLLDLVFPPRCLGCRRFTKQPVCPCCLAGIEPVVPPFCHRCGAPFDPMARGGDLCADCRARRRFPYQAARAVARYHGKLRELIHAFKFEGRQVLAGPLSNLMVDYLRREFEPPRYQRLPPRIPRVELVCPVPLHPRRLRQRGFNQAELLAEPVARELGAELMPGLLTRIRDTAPQVDQKNPADRAGNVREAFRADAGRLTAIQREPGGKPPSVVVVDDLLTTGATMKECARALRRAGAGEVYLFALARVVRGGIGNRQPATGCRRVTGDGGRVES